MPKKRFAVFYALFLLSLISLYRVPFIYPVLQDKFLPPMNRYLRFYIIGILSAVFLFYYLVLYYARSDNPEVFKPGRTARLFWPVTIAAFLFLCTSRALFSHDLFEYSFRARMLVLYHLNPYLHVPSKIPTDVFFPYLFWKNTPECYGPLWVILGLPHVIFFKASIFWTGFLHKFILLLFLLSSCVVFYRLCRQLQLKDARLLTLAFLANPLIIVMTLFDGHNEIAMVFFALCAAYFLLRSAYIRAFLVFCLAINIKFIYLLILPLFIAYMLINRKERLSGALYRLGLAAIIPALLTLLLWLPFGRESFLAILKYYRELSQNFWADSIPFAAHFLLGKAGLNLPTEAINLVFSLVFLGLYGYLNYAFWRSARTDRQAVFTFSALILLGLLLTNSTPFQAWYLVWVIPFLLLSGIKSKLLLVFLLSYFLIMNFWKRMSVLAIPMMLFYFILLKIPRLREGRIKFLYEG